jgi:hypothetical protein
MNTDLRRPHASDKASCNQVINQNVVEYDLSSLGLPPAAAADVLHGVLHRHLDHHARQMRPLLTGAQRRDTTRD